MASSYVEWVTQALSIRFLKGPWATKFETIMQQAKDRLILAAKDAVKAAMPALAPNDALGSIGFGRNIERYRADTDTSYRNRLIDAWNVWEYGGSAAGLLARMHDRGLVNVTIVAWKDYAGTPPAPWTTWWSAFWIYLDQPNNWTSDGLWGSPGTWGDSVAGPPPGPGVWGSNASYYEIQEWRSTIHKWKAAHEIAAQIVVQFPADTWGATETRWRG